MDVLVKVLRDARELGNKAECVDDDDDAVVSAEQFVLVDDSEAIALHELLGELL